MKAAFNGHKESLELLLAKRAKVDLQGKDGSRLKFSFCCMCALYVAFSDTGSGELQDFRMFGRLAFVVVLSHAQQICFAASQQQNL